MSRLAVARRKAGERAIDQLVEGGHLAVADGGADGAVTPKTGAPCEHGRRGALFAPIEKLCRSLGVCRAGVLFRTSAVKNDEPPGFLAGATELAGYWDDVLGLWVMKLGV